MKNGSTLLIIGNGFDLQCGLKSGYSDFFRLVTTRRRTSK